MNRLWLLVILPLAACQRDPLAPSHPVATVADSVGIQPLIPLPRECARWIGGRIVFGLCP